GQLSNQAARSVAIRLPDLARGNFLYARMAFDALEEGTLSPADLDELSPGVSDFYAKTLGKLFPEERTFQKEAQPLLRTLSAAMAPVPFEILDRISRKPQESEESTHRRLQRLRSYLHVAGRGGPTSTYALFHKSLGDWLNDAGMADVFWCSRPAG